MRAASTTLPSDICRAPACVAAGGGFSSGVTRERRPYVELAQGGASTGGASEGSGRRYPSSVTVTGGGGGNVGDPVSVTVTDKQWPKEPITIDMSRDMSRLRDYILVHGKNTDIEFVLGWIRDNSTCKETREVLELLFNVRPTSENL